jgi:O-glycosyl hydrolase
MKYIAIVSLILLNLVGGYAQSNIHISSTNLQQITHWGVWAADNRPDWGDDWVASRHPSVLNALYKDLGVNLARVGLDYNCYDKTTKGLNTYYLNALKSHINGFTSRSVNTYFISIWTPPPSMKTREVASGDYAIETSPGVWSHEKTHLRVDKEQEFIQYIVDALKWLKNNDASLPYALSFQNEPDLDPSYDGCVYDSVQYQRVFKNLRVSLNQNGLSTVKLIGPEGGNLNRSQWILGNKLSALDKDAELNSAMEIIGTHNYTWAYFNNNWYQNFDWVKYTNDYKTGVKNRTQEHWMTEYCAEYVIGDTTIDDYVISEARHFNSDLTNFGFTAWVHWSSWFKTLDNKYPMLGSGDPFVSTKLYDLFRVIWTNAVPGSYVRAVTTDDQVLKGAQPAPDLDMMALVNKDKMEVVLVNPTKSDKQVIVNGLLGTSLQNFKIGKYNAMQNIGGNSIVKGSSTITLSAQSVHVLVTNEGTDPVIIKDFEIVKTTTSPMIDGVPDAVFEKATYLYPKKIVNGIVSNSADLSVKVKSLWDMQNLYFLLEVQDETKISDSPLEWDDDGIELFFDTGNKKKATLGTSDYQFVSKYNSITMREFNGKSNSKILQACKNTATGYNCEIEIPWVTLGVSNPVEGNALGFDIAVDDDDDGNQRDTQLIWNGTANNWSTPLDWGKAILVSNTITAMYENDQIENQEVLIYPNPFNDQINLSIKQNWHLYDCRGQLIKIGYSDKIEGAELMTGMYLLRLENGLMYKVMK